MSGSIAIVGMACRYPGARSPAELWENVLAGRRAFRRMPPERLRLEDYHSTDRSVLDSIYSSQVAVIEDYEFDRVGFKVAASTYGSADLAHWLALDVATQALADAGAPEGEGLPRESTGVLLGNSLTGELSRANLMRLRWPYVRRVVGSALLAEGWTEDRCGEFLARLEDSYKEPFAPVTEETLAGALSNTIAGRIASHLDLNGGGYTVDGACASSLLAVAQACSALTAGDLDCALAGGVDLSLDPLELVGFSKIGALAAGDMRVFDERSAGFIPGEGCGFVVLRRLEDAVAAGCRIYAVVRGWGISSDGAGGITRPEVEGQLLAIRRAYRRAGFGIERVGLFEGHGTGTSVGDATELAALSRARREAAVPGPRVPIGSIKANVGHTKAAAGVASLVKATLAVHSQIQPPTTGCEEPHPQLRGEGAVLETLPAGRRWPDDLPLAAGVSAMGFGGINSHVVIEGVEGRRRASMSTAVRRLLASRQDTELILLTAATVGELRRHVGRLRERAPGLSRCELTDLAAEQARKLEPGRMRAALVAGEPGELERGLQALESWLEEGVARRLDPKLGVFLGQGGSGVAEPRIGFLFPGQGSPSHLGGGCWCHRFEKVADLYARAAPVTADDGPNTAIAQPAIITASLAALTVLEDLGIEASVAVGHSLGELAALHWGGALDRAGLLRIATARGQAMAELGDSDGAMASIAAEPQVVEEWVSGSEVWITGYNSPRQTVVSGRSADVARVVWRARASGIGTSRLPVSHAFHSPLVAAAAPRLAECLEGQEFRPLVRRVASSVAGDILAPDTDLRVLLVKQVTSAVRFTEAIAAAGSVDLWLEVGPGQVLSRLTRDLSASPTIALDAGGSSLRGMLAAAGAVFSLGGRMDCTAVFEGRFSRPFDLDRPPSFIGNPCELAPLPGVASVTLSQTVDRVGREDPSAVSGQQAAATSPLELVRDLVAARAQLPVASVGEDSRLLADLHLNSITVAELAADAARRLGLRPPEVPSEFADATVGELAAALSELGTADGTAAAVERYPAGVDSWVRPFTVELVERQRRSAAVAAAAGSGAWRVISPIDHPLRQSLQAALERAPGGGGVALCLPRDPDENHLGLFVEASRALVDWEGGNAPRFVVVQEQGGGGAFARSVHLERRGTATVVVDLPFDHPHAAQWVAEESGSSRGYTEAHYDSLGRRREPVLRCLDLSEVLDAPVLSGGEVLLVTGGGKGIGAECALALARETKTRVALIGRSRRDSDAELDSNLERFSAAGVDFRYLSADVTDPSAVGRAVRQVENELGPVAAVVHAAGANNPRLLENLDEASVRDTLAPKVAGLRNLLAALEPSRLRLLVTFGSIIAPLGMRGETDYALANEWLSKLTESFAREHPDCRCLALEWSVWSGVGMGERLGSLSALVRDGVTPITPEVGVATMVELLRHRIPSVAVLVTSRFGEVPTLALEHTELPFLRFLDQPRVHYPGVELVCDAELSADTDPYLRDHVFRGEPLLPAVIGLEAMAQAAMAVAQTTELPVFDDVEFHRPVVVPEGQSVVVRLASLVHRSGEVEVALRTEATGFAIDHFHATCRFPPAEGLAEGTSPTRTPTLVPLDARLDDGLSLRPESELYGSLLFHEGRFRRLSGYRLLRATECLAEISADGDGIWFGRFLPPDLVLGDPAARDAALHGIQACIPHSAILPTGVDHIRAGSLPFVAPTRLAARERLRDGDTFVYDLEVMGSGGEVLERWEGLRLKAVEELTRPPAWRPALLGPYVERRLQELLAGSEVGVLLEAADASSLHEDGRRCASNRALRRLNGADARIHRRSDGKVEIGGQRQVSVAHSGSLVLAVASHESVGCDLESVVARPAVTWHDLLGGERHRLAATLSEESGESVDTASTRVWTAIECLKKAGALEGAPLVLAGRAADGWQLLRSGRFDIATLVTAVAEIEQPVALAVLIGERP